VRGAAAHLWWAYYKVMKKREGVIAGSKNDAAKPPVPNVVSNKARVAKPTSMKAKMPAAKTSRARKPPKATP
jgi:DNA-3-methyladenine glycosylase II